MPLLSAGALTGVLAVVAADDDGWDAEALGLLLLLADVICAVVLLPACAQDPATV